MGLPGTERGFPWVSSRPRTVIYERTASKIVLDKFIAGMVIINEGAYDEFKKSNMKPSAFCKQKLGMRAVKRPEEVRRYWTPTSLQWAVEQYARLHRFEKGEFSLADILG